MPMPLLWPAVHHDYKDFLLAAMVTKEGLTASL